MFMDCFGSNLLGNELFRDPKFLGGIHRSLGGLELKIGEERSKNSFDSPWGAAPTRAPQDRLCPSSPDVPCQPERMRIVSVRQALAVPQSVKTP